MGEMPAWWSEKATKQSQNRRSRSMEGRVAREVGGRQIPGSGSSWRSPGDVKSDDDLIEHKYTDAASFVLKLADWEQARTDALRTGRSPAIIVEFSRGGRRLLITEYPE